MAKLGLPAYRFSVAWPRVMPDGFGAGQPARPGLLRPARRRLAGARDRAARDALPLGPALGAAARVRRLDGAAYAGAVRRLRRGGRCSGSATGSLSFGTLNEPYCSAFLGHASRQSTRPGWTDPAAAYAAAHHLNLAHGLAASALRSVAAGAEVSVSLNLAQVYPATESDEDREAAAHVDMIANRIFLEPMLRGRYPDGLMEATAELADWSVVRDGDLSLIHQPLDALGVNFYSPSRIGGAAHRPAAGSTSPSGRWVQRPGPRRCKPATPWPGTDRAWSVPQPGPYTEMGWRIEPQAFTDLLVRVGRDYPGDPDPGDRERSCDAPTRSTSPGKSSTRTGSPTCAFTWPPCTRRSPPGRTSAGTTCGRSSTTSSGRSGTSSGSGWCGSTTTAWRARRRHRPLGTAM